jgi:hypothetical protein
MKAVKRLFKRIKKDKSQAASSSGPTAKSEKPSASAKDPKLKHTNNSTREQTAFDIPSEGPHVPVVAVPTPTPKPENTTQVPVKVTQESGIENGAPKTNGKPPPKEEAQRSVPMAQDNSTPSKASGKPPVEEEDGRYKGVSASFTGMTANERFGIAEAVDPADMIKLGDAYDSIPLIEQIKLPRGGISMETKAVGRIQVSIALLCALFIYEYRRALTYYISFSLVFLRRQLKTVCVLVYLYHRSTLFRRSGFVEKWVLLLVSTSRSLNSLPISISLYIRNDAP